MPASVKHALRGALGATTAGSRGDAPPPRFLLALPLASTDAGPLIHRARMS
ncbi:hypothetical protein [Microbacterium capsulatum]|uniref:Uncharacterized protein n=1 Tax=Microbacterium capsulatum TaxID=3041921 RepID=A0ABU0XJ16_9MICO|nr:hypothetical protein [Microbacterium sp. ASV81]MDQ4214837.1 hypothetical protein [Microbacterium sp. ASV81]